MNVTTFLDALYLLCTVLLITLTSSRNVNLNSQSFIYITHSIEVDKFA